MVTTLLEIIHVFVCLFLMLVVLLQQGKGGGMGAAFGGGATQQVFGGRGAGNILTRATAICAGIFMLTSVSLAYVSSSGDRDLKARIVEEQRKGKGNEGTRVKTAKPKAPRHGAASDRHGASGSQREVTPQRRAGRLTDFALVGLLVALKVAVDAWVAPDRVLPRLGRRLRAHGHRAAVRVRAAPRSQRDELAPPPVLDRRYVDARRSGGRSARRARSAIAPRRPRGGGALRRDARGAGSATRGLAAGFVVAVLPWSAWLGVATVPDGWTAALIAAGVIAMRTDGGRPWAAVALLAASLVALRGVAGVRGLRAPLRLACRRERT